MLSIVIPAYNEEKRLANTLTSINSYLTSQRYDFEVIVVDDGSKDKTKQVALEHVLYRNGKLKLIENGVNRGKGYSVKRGILEARGENILFTDSDLSTPIEEIRKLLSFLNSGYDIVIGSRAVFGADIKIHQPFYRECMGKIFNFLVQFFVLKGIRDTQCGFKLFKAAVVKDIAKELKIDGFAFDVEMLYLAQKKCYKSKEVPIIWNNSFESKVNASRHSFDMFKAILTIKKLHA